MTRKRLPWQKLVGSTFVAAALVAAACEAPRPEPVAPLNAEGAKVSPELVTASDILHEFQVEKPASLAVGSTMPKYPAILREAGVEGEALISFVVNEDGTADPTTFKVIRSTHELFATAVRQALPQMRFVAAEVGGKKVRQMAQQPFSFTLPGTKVTASQRTRNLEVGPLEGKKLAFTVRRQDALAEEPNVVVYAFDGRELARSERDANLLQKIAPQSIHSIEVFKPRSCPATMTCPLIKIRLAKGQTLGLPTLLRPGRDETARGAWEPRAERHLDASVIRAEAVSPKMNIELLSRSGEVLARYTSRQAIWGKIDSEDISASEEYSGKACKGTACPLTRIWIKPGREGAYRKQ